MSHENKTKEELIDELNAAYQRIAELEAAAPETAMDAASTSTRLEDMPDMLFRLSADGTHLEYDAPQMEQLFIQPRDFLGKTVDEVLPSAVAARYKAHIQRTLGQGQKQVFEYYLDLQAGGRTYYEAYMGVADDNEVLVLVHDVTQRKQAEQRLRESDELYRITLSSVSDAVFVTDDSGNFVFICPNVSNIFAYSYQEVEAMGNIAELLGEDVFVGADLESEREIKNIDRQITNKYGQSSSVLVNVKRVSIKGGSRLYTCRDITERRRSEEQIRQLGERFSVLFHATPAVLTLTDLHDARFIEVNASFENIFGYSYGEVAGRSSTELNIWVNEDDRAVFRSRLLEQGSIRNTELQFRIKSGEIRSFFGSFEILTIDNQQLVLSALIDITEYQRLEEEAKKAEILQIELGKEKELVALKDRFISIVSHEFRTPLAIIQSSSGLLNRHYDKLPVERRQATFKQIELQIAQLTDMIDGVLSIGQTRSGTTHFNPSLTDLETFCRTIFEQIQYADSADHDFEFVSDIPDQPRMIDANLLNHVLTNLLSNAVKYSPARSRIRFALTQEQDKILITVRDEGIGIPEDDQARLFEPFHRAGNVGKVSGTGLGLSIVKEYVELHGGTIEVDSKIGQGSTFMVTLPIV